MPEISNSELDRLLTQVPQTQASQPQLSVWADRPAAPPPDLAPPGITVRFPLASTVNAYNMAAPLVERVNRLYDLMPENVRSSAQITSARRSEDQQAAAYQRYQEGRGGLAAPPGHSRHEQGAAFDWASGPALTWLHTNEGKQVLSSLGLEMPFAAKGDPGHMQLSGAAEQGERVTAARRSDNNEISDSALAERVSSLPRPGERAAKTSPSLMEAIGTGEAAHSEASVLFGEQSAALTAGVVKGIADVPLGIAQATLPRESMRPVEEQMRRIDDQVQEITGKHPNFNFAGRMVGSTLAILLGARALGPIAAPLMPAVISRGASIAWEWLTPVGRGVGTGAAAGGTLFYPEGAEREGRPFGINARAFDSVFGGFLGGMAAIVARSTAWAARNLSDSEYAKKFMAMLQQTASGMTRNTERPLAETLAHYSRVEQQAASKYALRNDAGRQFEGFPSGVGASEFGAEEGFVQALDGALDTSRKAGVETRRAVGGAVARVKSVLGIDKEEGKLADWRAQQKVYEEQLATAQEARAEFAFNPPARPNQDPGAFAQAKAQYELGLEQRGVIPQLPEAPAPYQPRPVSAEAYAQARTALNAALRRSRDPAARAQLGIVLREMDGVATETAAQYGMEAQQFIRRAQVANKFYEENVAPLRQFFGGKTAKEAAGRPNVPLDGMTPAAFYDKVARVIESDDIVAIRDVAKVLGPRGRDNMAMIAANEALSKLERREVPRVYQYVQDHKNSLFELLGRDSYEQLVGTSKVADELVAKFSNTQSRPKAIFDWSHSFGPALAFYSLFQGHFLKAAEITVALPAYHFAASAIQQIHLNPFVRPLIKSAAGMKPESAELKALVGRIESRLRTSAAILSRSPSP